LASIIDGDAMIRTSRLELRPPIVEDAQAIFDAFASDPRVMKYMDWPPMEHLDLDKAARQHAQLVADMVRGKRIAWVIRKLDEPRLCGKIELRVDDDEGNVGYLLAASHWGQGIMPEAVSAVLRFAQQIQLRRVTGTCDPENHASARVLEKCGFAYIGRLKRALVRPSLSNEPRDSDCYELRF
jgi:[ribosomal protein S5]-alanine N-acetyltransferase